MVEFLDEMSTMQAVGFWACISGFLLGLLFGAVIWPPRAKP